MHIISIVNQKGGSGKTTTTVNLGAALAELGDRVLILDLDPQASTTEWLTGETPPGSLHDLFMGEATAEELIMATGSERLELVAGSSWLGTADKALAGEVGAETILRRRIRKLRKAAAYDFVLIDCPPNLNILTVNALAASDSVLIPVESHVLAMGGSAKIMQTVEVVRDRLNEDLEILGILACRLDRRTTHCAEVEAELRRSFGSSVCKTVIRENVRLAEAPSFRKTILQYDKRSHGAEDYRNLAREVRRRSKRLNQ